MRTVMSLAHHKIVIRLLAADCFGRATVLREFERILGVAEDVLDYLIEVHLFLWQNLLLREGGFFYAELFLEFFSKEAGD